MYQEDEKRELDFWSRHFVNATRKCLLLNIKYRGKFCNKKAQTFSFSRNLVVNNHVHFSVHPPSLNNSVHLGPRLLSIKDKKGQKHGNRNGEKNRCKGLFNDKKWNFTNMALKFSINNLWTSCTSMPREFCRKLPFLRIDGHRKKHVPHDLACVASVSSRVRRESWDESKKRGMTGEGEGNEGTFFFFCSRSNFRAVTRLETLATQATHDQSFAWSIPQERVLFAENSEVKTKARKKGSH